MILRKLRIRNQLLIIAISSISVMLFIIFFFYIRTADIYRQRNDEYTKELFTQIRQTISYNCDIINNIVTSTAYNQVVQEYLTETNQTKKFELYGKMSNLLENMMDIKEGILDIVVMDNNGNAFDLNGGTQLNKEVYGNIPERVNAYYFGLRKFENSNVNVNCFVVGTNIYSINTDKMPNMKIGKLLIFVDTNALIGKKESSSGRINEQIYLLDRDNNVFSSNGNIKNFPQIDVLKNIEKGNSAFISKISGKTSIVNAEYIPSIDGEIISIIPKNKLLYNINELRNFELIIFTIGISILIVPFTMVINNIIQPIGKLVTFMNRIKEGNLRNLKIRIDLQGYSEMSIMAQEFNSMLDEIESLTNRLIAANSRLYEAELEEKQSELGYLRSQINPHFLYNTLESIKGIAAEEGVTGIVEMSKALAKVFRYSIKGTDVVLLSEELMIVKSYVDIQQIRFVDRFDVEYEFDEAVLNNRVPKMILQPIVENAIYHGLEIKMDKGHLSIGGKIEENNTLLIWVRDDGIGMEPETLDRICKNLSDPGMKSRHAAVSNHGIGLINVNNRIKLTYGLQYGITIKSSQEMGTEVLIRVPIKGDNFV